MRANEQHRKSIFVNKKKVKHISNNRKRIIHYSKFVLVSYCDPHHICDKTASTSIHVPVTHGIPHAFYHCRCATPSPSPKRYPNMPSPASPRFPRLTYKSAAVSGRRDHPRAATTLGTTPYRRRRTNRNPLPRLPSTRRSRQSRPLHSDVTAHTDSIRSSRAIYNATTASARAAEMRSQRQPLFLDEHRDRPSRSGTDIADVSRQPPVAALFYDREEPKRVTRVVVKRRVIRGSPVFRPATEEELDEFLQVEKLTQMTSVPETEIDIPPTADHPQFDGFDIERHVCAVCAGPLPAKRAMPKRGMRRVSSLLSWGACEEDEVLRVSDMAAMDEYKAVALFLREIRRYRKEMFVSVQEKSDRPEKKRKDRKRRMVDNKDSKDLKRSASADNPEIMRIVRRQERLIANAKKRMMDSERRSRSEVVCLHDEECDVEETKREIVDEEECGSLRILTAIEPVDPTEALDDDDLGRGDSFRQEFQGRRRGLRMVGEAGILGRLRSFRKKPQPPT